LRDTHDQVLTQKDVEGHTEPVQQVIFLKNRKRPTWLRTTLQEEKGYTTKGTLGKVKNQKGILDMQHYDEAH